MIGKFIVNQMGGVLDTLAMFILAVGTWAGHVLATSLDRAPWEGALLGALVALTFNILTLGVLFLLLDIHKTLEEIRDLVKNN